MTSASGGFLALIALLASPLASSMAQQVAKERPCDGLVVSRIDIRPEPPPFSGSAKKWQAAAHSVGLHHATTRPDVIRAFLSLRLGQECTEFRREESERVLRAQPFLADASVRIERDAGGTAAVIVTTTDEIPVLVTGRFHGIQPQSFGLGNDNVGGSALYLSARIERAGAYRTGYGARVEQDAFAGHPYRLIFDANRYLVGHRVSAEVEHPFFTNLQRISWHAGMISRDDYERFERPARDPLALLSDDQSWDLSGLLRVFGTSTVALVGGALSGRRFDPASSGIIVSDSGLQPDTGSALNGRYRSFHAGRVGVIGGIRRVFFQQVNGFDALVGTQDVARGAMFGVFAGKGISQLGEPDIFLSSAFYAGASSPNSLLGTLGQLEGRRDPVTHRWDSVVGSARTAFYWGSAPGAVLMISDELSGGNDSRLPLQLSFREVNGGLIGYRSSGLAGAVRNIVHSELRFSAASLIHKADLGFAAFSEIGTLRAGDAPYGVNATRRSVGVSILAAYPTRAKRLYRVDLGIPLTRQGVGAGKVEVRFSSADRTQGFWIEPQDVSRARTGTEPSRLFAWPER